MANIGIVTAPEGLVLIVNGQDCGSSAEVGIGDVIRLKMKPPAPKWPQPLKIYVHDQKDECEEMQKWLEDRGIDLQSEAGRRIAGAAYEHEMVYDAYEDGRTVLCSVDGRAVEDPAE